MRFLHCLYCFTERSKRWFLARFTPLGRMGLLVVCISLVFGLNTERTMIYQIFAFSCCLLLVSFLLTLRFRSSIVIRRLIPDACSVGRTLQYRLRIENVTQMQLRGIGFQENIVQQLPSYEEFITTRETGEEKRNFFDRKMGYYRWLWLVDLAENAKETLFDLHVASINHERCRENTVFAEVSLLPRRRGVVNLSGYSLVRVDPLGLCKGRMVQSLPAKLLVYPKIYELPPLAFPVGKYAFQGRDSMAQQHGGSDEFFAVREYQYGDPVKHIDWKGTARAGSVLVKQFRAEYFARYAIVLDNFTANEHDACLEEAISIAASYCVQGGQNVLDLIYYGSVVECMSLGAGYGTVEHLLGTLAVLAPNRDRTFARMDDFLMASLSRFSGILFLLLDLDVVRKKTIRLVLRSGLPVKVVQIVPEEGGIVADGELGIAVHKIAVGQVMEQVQTL